MEMEVMEVLMALAAAGGTLLLGWLLFGRLVTPPEVEGQICAMLPAGGDGEGLEQNVNSLLWLAAGRLPGLRVVVVDVGLSPAGRTRAELLSRRAEVELCRPEEVSRLLQR